MMTQNRITRDDLESRFRQLQDSVQAKVDDKKKAMTSAGVFTGALLLLVIFWLGHRRGKRQTTLVEIRRI